MQSEVEGYHRYREKLSDNRNKAVKKQKKLERLHKREEERIRKCEEKFGKILLLCEGLVSKTAENGGDIFVLLDPLACDHLCQIHCVLMYNILHKFVNNRRFMEMLEGKGREILSRGVLLSLLKTEYKDKLSFVVKEIFTVDFGGSLLDTRGREKYYIKRTKVEFNAYSVDFIRSVSRGSIGDILNECEATCYVSHVKFLPLYASTSAVMSYIEREKLPMIVSIWQYVRHGEGEDATYSLRNDEVRFYAFEEEKKGYFYKRELSDAEKEEPVIVIACYSLTHGDIEKFSTDYKSFRKLLMSCAASGRQLPKTAVFPGGYADGDDYVRGLHEKHIDILNEYNEHYEFAKKINIISNARYAKVTKTSRLREGNSSLITLNVERSDRDVVFAMDHVFLSSYTRECQNHGSVDLSSRGNRSEILEIREKKVLLTEKPFSDYQNL